MRPLDPDDPPAFLTAVVVDQPAHGHVAFRDDGSFTYTFDPNTVGQFERINRYEEFSYTVLDGFADQRQGPRFSVTATLDISPILVELIGTTRGSDADSDGVADAVEVGVPDLNDGRRGDGNGDGIPDSQQANDASLPDINARLLPHARDRRPPLVDVRATTDPHPIDSPGGGLHQSIYFPYGFLSFRVKVDPLGSTSVTLYLPGPPPAAYSSMAPRPRIPRRTGTTSPSTAPPAPSSSRRLAPGAGAGSCSTSSTASAATTT
jgi:hypothetical protein